MNRRSFAKLVFSDLFQHQMCRIWGVAVLAAALAESRIGQARLPACRVSWAKQAPSWRGVVGAPEDALTTAWHDSLESFRNHVMIVRLEVVKLLI